MPQAPLRRAFLASLRRCLCLPHSRLSDAVMTEDDVLAEFRAADALLEGHFILSSGLRSPRYLQCARVLMDPARGSAAGEGAGRAHSRRTARADHPAVVSPAMGGVIAGHEMARALGVEAMFVERPDGTFELRRGFRLEPGQQVLMMEDVVTTGLSSREAIAAIERAGGGVIAAAALVDRSNGAAELRRAVLPADPAGRADLRRRRAAARTGGDPRDQAGEPGGLSADLSPPAGRQHRPCRDRAERARGGLSRSGAGGVAGGGGGRGRDHRASARGPAAHHRRRHRAAVGRADRSRSTWRWRRPTRCWRLRCATARMPPASSPKSARSARPRAGSTPRASTTGSRRWSANWARRDIRVSLFIEPDPRQIEAALRLGAPVVELHTGRYAELSGAAQARGTAPAERRGGAGGEERDRGPCRPRPDLRQCRADRGDPAGARAQHRAFPGRRGAVRRAGRERAADARRDGCGAVMPSPIMGRGSRKRWRGIAPRRPSPPRSRGPPPRDGEDL